MAYTPNPRRVQDEMLQSIGLHTMEELFSDIPDEMKLKRPLALEPGKSEIELRRNLQALANKNINVDQYPCFLGAGAYDHFIPAVVDQILLRSEFYTSYTPYQPEISQGVLQAIFEYQTLICQLTDMEVSNASLYDGGTALAEACQMACDVTKRSNILLADTVHPEYAQIVNTYRISGKMKITSIAGQAGGADIEQMLTMINQETAAVVIQHPNFYGHLEEISRLEEAIHQQKGLLIMIADPVSLGILKSPGQYGADIVVGEGQSLGNSLSFGGPYLGFMASTKKYMRKMPGRIVGQTLDYEGRRAFVLTLQAREQHIRREQASSNICSNQALNALAASIYLSMTGAQGLQAIATRCHQLAVYARDEFVKKGLELKYDRPFFKEFALRIKDPQQTNRMLLENGIIGGYELDDALLLAFTEKRTRAEIDKLVALIGGHEHD
jgi:glycine dehydrogenase subunit 1